MKHNKDKLEHKYCLPRDKNPGPLEAVSNAPFGLQQQVVYLKR